MLSARRLAVPLVLLAASCGARSVLENGAGGAPSNNGGATSSSASASSSAASSSGTTGCTPGSAIACYDGPPATKNVGACHEGTTVCLPDGSGFGPCTGEILPSPEDCASPIDEDCDGNATCAGTILWQRVFPAPILSVAADASGNFFLAFWGFPGLDLGDGVTVTGNGTWSVAKIGPGGHVLWTRDVGPNAAAGGNFRHIATDGVNAYLGADVSEQASSSDFVAKIGPDGKVLWQVTSPAQLNNLDSVIVAADGNGTAYAARSPATAGTFGTMLPAGMGSALVALDANSSPKWGRLFDTPLSDIAGLPGGGVVVVGGWLAGPETATGCGVTPTSAFVAAYDQAGTCLWLQPLTGSAGTVAASASALFAIDVAADMRIARRFELDGTAGFSLPFNATTANLEGLAAGPGGLSVPLWSMGPIDVAGQTFTGSPDVAAIFRVGAGGNFLWGRASSCDTCFSETVAVDPMGNTLLAGFPATTVDFGAGPLMVENNGSYLIKFGP